MGHSLTVLYFLWDGHCVALFKVLVSIHMNILEDFLAAVGQSPVQEDKTTVFVATATESDCWLKRENIPNTAKTDLIYGGVKKRLI